MVEERAAVGVLVGNERGADPGQSCLAVMDDIQSAVGRRDARPGPPRGVGGGIIFISCKRYPLPSTGAAALTIRLT